MKKIISIVLAALIMMSTMTGCSVKYEKFSSTFFGVFDTVIQFIAYRENYAEFEKMDNYVREKYTELNRLYDIYTKYEDLNNIYTINKNAGKEPVKVSQEIIDLLKFSKEWYSRSEGNMNVAMGSVLKVWHDVREEYEVFGTAELPQLDYLQEKARYTDIDCVVIDEENMTVYITDENVQLDVGAVAKGYATEIVADGLVAMGCDSFAISAGGNVKTYGAPKDERERWGIGVQNPAVDEKYMMIGGNIDTAYFNTEISLVCSGGYQRYMVIDGRRYHHLIDPDTLYPEEVYQGVAVFHPDSGVADALSTAVFLMEPAQAVEFIESVEGADCMLVEIDGTLHITDGTKAYLASEGITSQTP